MAHDITKKTQRAKLEPRREPYWRRIDEGFFIGFRRMEEGEGTWIARLRVDGKQKYHALSESFDDFDDAQRAAIAWKKGMDQGVAKSALTVEDVCREYVKHRRVNRGQDSANDAEGRFKRLVYGKRIGKISLAKLQTKDVRTWVNAMLAMDDDDDEEDLRRSKDSANRNLAELKAALNHALKDRLVATDAGWKTVVPFTKVRRRRVHMLDLKERTALLNACLEVPKVGPDLQPFMKGLLLTAARPGELAKTVVSDFDKANGTLILDGKTGRRVVTLSTAATAFLTEQCKGRIANAPIFSTEYLDREKGTVYRTAWNKDSWKDPFRDAAKAAKLPVKVVTYTLRHTAISELIMGGMQATLVAKIAGTSTKMIEENYLHLQVDATRRMLDGVAIL